jgi:hypothetical protein
VRDPQGELPADQSVSAAVDADATARGGGGGASLVCVRSLALPPSLGPQHFTMHSATLPPTSPGG